ncbi:DUF3570 domain-containing protein [Polyangium aurulentum]|uniref:DUF3570 domain-containing protein n=1 Tax=Polyangium aurulentum TaxID=2567896 RepID=UPI0010ADE23F|nr:DUF3570 domain-containing protein [Polyangium aurulentum]UQA56939.1 DUF3570 domain-containing protein [Polyangium aurulentum]
MNLPRAASALLLLLLARPLLAAEPRAISAKVNAEASVYSDDNHVDVFTPAIAGSIENQLAGWSVSGHYLVDVVTAASPDIVASASPPFQEVRHAGSVGGTYRIKDLGLAADVAISSEPDYLSLSGGLHGTLDLARKNVTLLLGYAYRNDTAGRAGTPFATFQRKIDTHSALGGVSIVVDRATLATFQVDAVLERGNQSKPYRYVPLFEVGTANLVPPGASVAEVNAARLDARPLEELPRSRDRYALTGRISHRFRRATLRVEERLYLDTWGLWASTTDFRYMLDIGRRVLFWPHARVHVQTGADFWRRAYEVRRPAPGILDFPVIRTGDRELGPLYTLTGGGGVSVQISPVFSMGLQVDGQFTSYLDALYVSRRLGILSALTAQASWE